LGLDTRQDDYTFPIPPLFANNKKFVDIVAGNSYTIAIKGNGVIYAFGENYVFFIINLNLQRGQFGNGDTNSIGIPTLMNSQNYGIMKVACGAQNTLFLKSESSCFGKSPSSATICSKNGICVNGNCICESGFSGNECQFTTCFGKNSTDPNVCSGLGNCIEKDVCECHTGYIFNSKEKLCKIDSNTKLYVFGNNNV
jgi:alpha-tubulin suppressor-like RCC1 family protein